MTTTQKPWGNETLIEHNDQYAVKSLTMNPGCRCSLQYHQHKRETIYVIAGALNVEVEGVVFTLAPGNYITIAPGQQHRMSAHLETAVYLEASTPHLDDVIRVQDDYGRME